jgi:hypothetical protein
VSDVVGYVLMIGVILVGVGVTATVGLDHIEGIQTGQTVEGAERGLALLERTFEELESSRAESRRSRFSLGRGRLVVNESGTDSGILVNVSGAHEGPTRYSLGAVEYRVENTRVAFEGGGAFRAGRDGRPVVVAEPTLECRDRSAIVSFTTVTGPANDRSYGGGDATIIVTERDRRLLFPKNRTGPDSQTTATGVNVSVDSPYGAAWNASLSESSDSWQQRADPGLGYRCEPDTGTVYVRQTVVNVSVRH